MKCVKTISAAIGALAIMAANAPADAALVTVGVAPPGINEALLDSCIFGNHSLGCDDAYLLPAGKPNGSVLDLTHSFLVADIRAIVGDVFSVGVDANIATGSAYVQMLTEFSLVLEGGGVLFELDQPSPLDAEVVNGNGFTDYLISQFSLLGLNDEDVVTFHISLTGLTGGAEQFFFVDEADVGVIPVPAALWLMGAGLAGLGFTGRRSGR